MAKRNLDKTGSEDSKAPERRRRTTSTDVTGKTAAPKARGRRRSDVAADAATSSTADTVAEATAAFAAGHEEATHAEAANGHASGGNGHGDVQVPHDHIALRAYHLYLERGGQPGDQFEDWVTAERQLREQFARASR